MATENANSNVKMLASTAHALLWTENVKGGVSLGGQKMADMAESFQVMMFWIDFLHHVEAGEDGVLHTSGAVHRTSLDVLLVAADGSPLFVSSTNRMSLGQTRLMTLRRAGGDNVPASEVQFTAGFVESVVVAPDVPSILDSNKNNFGIQQYRYKTGGAPLGDDQGNYLKPDERLMLVRLTGEEISLLYYPTKLDANNEGVVGGGFNFRTGVGESK